MSSISQRAVQAVQSPRNSSDRDRLREEWRLAAEAEITAEDLYERLQEGKKIYLDEMIETLLEQNEKLAANKAERMARTSQSFKSYLHRMHDARLAWRRAQLDTKDKDRIYWQSVSAEATERSERRMSR